MMRNVVLASVVSLASLASLAYAPDACADGADGTATTSAAALAVDRSLTVATPRHWYGWEPLMADGTAIAMMLTSRATSGVPSQTLTILGTGDYLFGSPLIHLTHNHPGKAAASLGLRAVLPVLGFLTATLGGAAVLSAEGQGDALFGGAIYGADYGVYGGMAIAALLDDVLVAQENVLPVRAKPDMRATIEPRLTPTIGGGTIGVGGTF